MANLRVAQTAEPRILPGGLPLIPTTFAYGALFIGGFAVGSLFDIDEVWASVWYPPAGVRLAFLMLLGWRFGVIALIAEILSAFVVGNVQFVEASGGVSLTGLARLFMVVAIPPAAAVLAVYGASHTRFDPRLRSIQDVLILCVVAGVAALGNAILTSLWYLVLGWLPWPQVGAAVIARWTGDVIGCLTFAPLILLVGSRAKRFGPWRLLRVAARGFRRLSAEAQPGGSRSASVVIEALVVVGLVAGVIVFAWTPDEPPVWHPLFLPLMWAAGRFGLPGAAAATAIVSTATALVASASGHVIELNGIQLFLVVLAASGLMLGAAVSELRIERAALDRKVAHRVRDLRREADRRREAEQAALAEKERAETYLAVARTLIVVLDAAGRVRIINQEAAKILGYARDDLIGRDWFEVAMPGSDRPRLRREFARFMTGPPRSPIRFRGTIVTRTGGCRQIDWYLSWRADPQFSGGAMFCAGIDVTARVAAEERARFLATHDGTTGLPNRVWLHDGLKAAIARSRRHGTRLALTFVDLDGFKDVNDRFGHEAGDQVLREVARRLREHIRETDGLARFGGDEFVILWEDVHDPGAAIQVAEKLLTTLRPAIAVTGGEVTVGASLGIALFPDDGETADALLRAADAAMYAVKYTRGNGVRLAGEARKESLQERRPQRRSVPSVPPRERKS